MCKPSHVNCIVPSHMLKGLLEHKQKKMRDIAMNTLVVSERTRAHRAVIGLARIAQPGDGLNRTIYDMRNQTAPLPGRSTRREGEPPSSDRSANEAYDGLGHTYDFFRDVFGRDSIDGNGMRLDASVHFGTDYLNAFWDGSQMVFGDGDGRVFLPFTQSLDVIAHELGHGVTEKTAGLVYENQPGALNESFSDVFGSLVKQYVNGEDADDADWLIGNDILGPEIDGVALRSMKDPGSAYDDPQLGGRDPQPKHMSEFLDLPNNPAGDWGGVHINSGIPNHAFYLAATNLGGKAWTRTGRIWYQTLLALNPQSEFGECAALSISIADRIYGTNSDEHKAVREAWREVGVTEQLPVEAAAKTRVGKRKKKRKADRAAVDNLHGSLKHLADALNNVLDAIEEV